MSTSVDEVRLLKPREAAALLAVSVRQIDILVASGRLKPVRLTKNGNRRFKVADLAALVDGDKED